MACALKMIPYDDGKTEAINVVRSQAIHFDDIEAVVLGASPGTIEDIVLKHGAQPADWYYSFAIEVHYEQVATIDRGYLRYEQYFCVRMPIDALSDSQKESITTPCKLVLIHYLANGQRLVQGLEVEGEYPYFTSSRARDTRAHFSPDGDTVLMMISGTSATLSPMLTDKKPVKKPRPKLANILPEQEVKRPAIDAITPTTT